MIKSTTDTLNIFLLVLLIIISLTTGCYHYRVIAREPDPATECEKRTVHSLLWGLMQARDISADALFVFTRYSPICIIDLDAFDNQTACKFLRFAWRALDERDTPYTIHWEKTNELTAASVRKMYGESLDTWLNVRRNLLDEKSRHSFSSPFTDQSGLSE